MTKTAQLACRLVNTSVVFLFQVREVRCGQHIADESDPEGESRLGGKAPRGHMVMAITVLYCMP
jgi:hypothetical protein